MYPAESFSIGDLRGGLMQLFRHPPEGSVLALLAECGLPTLDLVTNDFGGFLGCASDERLVGVVGLELHGADALLRSLAVSSASRRKGCGRALVEGAERLAMAHGVETIYLLTETAEGFFAALGYERVAREDVSDAIRRTEEFSRLCPQSAAVMRKAPGRHEEGPFATGSTPPRPGFG